ncbi:MAG: penicillin-binding protein activator [Rhodospirillales bacterium]|nr:penicillin-binding protein activator [Rhodospirillales bacterium]
MTSGINAGLKYKRNKLFSWQGAFVAAAILTGSLLTTGCEQPGLGLLNHEVNSIPRTTKPIKPRPPYTRVPHQQPQQAALPPQEDVQPRRTITPRIQLEDGIVRVGLLLPTSGTNARWGRDLLNAAQLALFDFGKPGFELLIHDTKGTPEGAAEAADQALEEGASLILGPLLSSSVQAVSPMAQQAGVNVLAFSNNQAALAENVYLLGFMPSEEVKRVVSYAASRGITNFAVLGPDNAYGRTILQAARDAVENSGGNLTQVSLYDPYLTDFNNTIRSLADYDTRRANLLTQREKLEARPGEVAERALKRLENLQTIGELPFEALLIAAGGKQLQSIAALLPFYDIDPNKVRMLGTGQWDVAGIGTEPALIGGWYAAPQPEARQRFIAHFKEAYGRQPSRLATLAYDSVALSAVLGRQGNSENFSTSVLTSASGFAGRDGIFRFTHSGTNERGLAVMEVQNRTVKVVSPSPDSF